MGRGAILHLLRSRSPSYHLTPRNFQSGFHRFRFEYGILSDNRCVKTNPVVSVRLPSVGRRWMSQSPSVEDDSKISIGPLRAVGSKKEEKGAGVVYYGPISSTIKKVKLLSLSTCCLSISLGPVITYMTSPDMSMILKGAVASTVVILSASTTAALHWFVSPYVHKLKWQPGSDTFEVEMLSWLARHVPRTIRFADIEPPNTNRPFVTFKAKGSYYFIDTDHCHNKDLLEKLIPQKGASESAQK